MTTNTLQSRPTLRLLPLYRSELSRTTHRRLFRVLSLLLLGGILVISVIVFFVSRDTAGPTTEELEKNRAQEQMFYDQCVTTSPPDKVQRFCGDDPSTRPLEQFDYGTDRRYKANDNLPAVIMATVFAVAGIAFIVGASTGGAEWSSRSMTLQLLWEPRRMRLLTIKWLGLLTAVIALAIVAVLLALGLGALTASLRGTWGGHLDPAIGTSLWPVISQMALRGLVFTALAATFGFAVAILVRNTGAALGTAFVYFAVGELAIGLVFQRYGSVPFLLSSNSLGFMLPGGLPDVPGRNEVVPGSGGYVQPVLVDLTNLRSFFTLLCYAALLVIPASWSFTRRDVG